MNFKTSTVFRQRLRNLLMIACLWSFSSDAIASHYRYGNVSATKLSETSTTVTYQINLSEAWRLNAADPASYFNITGGNTGSFTIYKATVTDPSGQWTNATGSTTITLNKSATPTLIYAYNCCKISTTINNHDQNWYENITLNTGAAGNTPVSTMPAIINMPTNATAATFVIPASDPDPGSTLTFGVPAFTGYLAGESNPSGFSVNSTTGQITLNTVGKSIGQLYNAMVTVTDNDGNQIMLDFIIQMVGPSNPPAFDYSANMTPTNGTTYNVIAGQTISFPIHATDTDPGSTVSLSVAGLPSYITSSNFSPALPATGSGQSTTTFSWTPSAAQVGSTNVLNFIATDNVGVQTTTSVTLKVVSEPAPTFVSPTPGEASLRQIVTGQLHQDVITAQSGLGSNVSIAYASVPSGATLSPAVPTAGANPGTTTLSWTPTPAEWGVHSLDYTATISAYPTIFSTREYQIVVNTPPAFTSTAITTAAVGVPYTYNIVVADPDQSYGDALDIIASTLPSWLTFTDNHDGTATLTGTPTAANVGLNAVDLEAEDIYHHGNPGEVAQNFDIDVACIVPAFTVCAANQTLAAGANCNQIVNYTTTATGTPAPAYTYTFSGATVGSGSGTGSGATFNKGVTNVIVTATNTCGYATCSFTVTVNDSTAPALDMATLPAISAECSATVTTTPTATDICAGTVTATTTDPLTYNAQGTYTIHWTYDDGNGNTNTQTQTVTIHDTTAPTVITQPVTVTLENGAVQITAAEVNNGSYDNCTGLLTYTLDNSSFDCGDIGSNTVTLTVADANGNTNSATAIVTVVGSIPSASITVTPANSVFTGGVPTNIYLGYGPQTATLTANAVNGTAFSYDWSVSATSNSLSNTNQQTTTFTPLMGGLYSYTVEVTNEFGCSNTVAAPVVFCVKDIREYKNGQPTSKVNICHVPNGNNSNAHTLTISTNAVAAHLSNHSGDHLGSCDQTCGGNLKMTQAITAEEVKVYPNPNNGSFTLVIPSTNESSDIRIMDMHGRLVMRKVVAAEDGTKVKFDMSNLAPTIYFVEVVQGETTTRTRIIVQ